MIPLNNAEIKSTDDDAEIEPRNDAEIEPLEDMEIERLVGPSSNLGMQVGNIPQGRVIRDISQGKTVFFVNVLPSLES